jgi:hypothetical protein
VVAVNGPEHYRESEAHLAEAASLRRGGFLEDMACEVAVAQVHATLALAAATALESQYMESEKTGDAWMRATASTKPAPPSEQDGGR